MCLLSKKQLKLSEAGKESFIVAKLSEIAERATQVLVSLQVSLGFVMAFNTTLLAIIVAIGQNIDDNIEGIQKAASLPEFLHAILCSSNIMLWCACALFAFIGGRSNLIALEIHLHSVGYHDRLVDNYNEYLDELSKNDFPEGICKLPTACERIKEGTVERIYAITAGAFYGLCAACLTCTLSSLAYSIFNDDRTYLWIAISFIISGATCMLLFSAHYRRAKQKSLPKE